MKKNKRTLSDLKFSLFEAITTLAIGAGSKTQRLDEAFESSIRKLFGSSMLLNAMSSESATIYKILETTCKKVEGDFYEKHENGQILRQCPSIRPIRYIHYKKANKIIELIIALYESICNDLQ